MKVVLVDDDEVLLRTLSRGLQHKLELAPEQVVCLDEQASEEQLIALSADCYILDLRLAERSGLHLIKPLRQALPDCCILLLTGYASIATAVSAIKLGADDYLMKPIDLTAIVQRIRTPSQAVVSRTEESLLSADELEWEHIQQALSLHDGNISLTARSLKMHRRTLQRKIAKRRPQKKRTNLS